MRINNIDYPIKYAIQTHYAQSSSGKDSTKREPIGYTVSKVYYLGTTMEPNSLGELVKKHHVVYPFANILDISDNKRTYPRYDENGVCYNEEMVDEVFDSYEAAEAVRGECYRSFYFYFMSGYPSDIYNNNMNSLMREFFDQTQIYELYELQGLSLTEDMHVDENTKGREKIL